jgi:thymidylate kinase
MKIILRKLFPNKLPASGNSTKRDKAFTKIWVQKIWINFAIFDLILLYGIYFRLKKKIGYIIIADRYLWDTYIDFSLRFEKIKFENFFLWKFLKRICPIPDHSFIITIPVDESLRRSLLKKEPFSENINERKKRYKLYESLISDNKWDFKINGMETINNIHSKVKSKLK